MRVGSAAVCSALAAWVALAVAAAAPATALQIALSPSSVIGGSGSYWGNYDHAANGAQYVFDSQVPGPKIETTGPPTGNLWSGKEHDPAEYFVVDLGAEYLLDTVDLYNSHNGSWNDRWTGGFTISASNTVAAPASCETGAGTCGVDLVGASTLLSGTLVFDADPILAQTFAIAPSGSYRYLRFDASTPVGANGLALNEMIVSGTLVPEPGTAAFLALGLAGLAGSGRRRTS